MGQFTRLTSEMPTRWHVCFLDEAVSPIVKFLNPRGFRHVAAVGWLPAHKLWLLYDVQFGKTTVAILGENEAGAWLTAGMNGGGVLSMPAPKERVRWQWWQRFGFWCVPSIKHLLGLRCVAMLPHQLHRYMLKHGALALGRTVQHSEDSNGQSCASQRADCAATV